MKFDDYFEKFKKLVETVSTRTCDASFEEIKLAMGHISYQKSEKFLNSLPRNENNIIDVLRNLNNKRYKIILHLYNKEFASAANEYLQYCSDWWPESIYLSIKKDSLARKINTDTILLSSDRVIEKAIEINYLEAPCHIKNEEILRKNSVSFKNKIESVKTSSFSESSREWEENSRLKAQNAEIEKRKRDKEETRITLLNKLENLLLKDYLGLDGFYKSSCIDFIDVSKFNQLKSDFVEKWIHENLSANSGQSVALDSEQIKAIATTNEHVQVIARAGSGKTATLVNRAFFLQKHCSVASNEMLLLAFNRKASKEMEGRLKILLGNSIPHVMTFHALARAIVKPKQDIVYNDSAEENQGLDSVFGDVIRDRLLEDEFLGRVRTLMLAQFKDDWDALVEGGYDLTPVELLRYRRNLARETLRGEYVKSNGEKVIANFLFEHGIPYNYEKAFYWQGIIYKPDFTLLPCSAMSKGVIIEYYGLANTDPDYDAQIIEKRDYWAKDDKYLLIELTPNDFSRGIESFEATLQDLLENTGITCNRLPEEQVWSNIKPRAIKRFSSAMSGFVGRCRKMWLLPDDLKQMIAAHQSLSKGEDWFLDLAIILYSDYLERLEANNQEDFDGLMQAAVSIVDTGTTRFERRNESGDFAKLRYVFVDEFQDFSELFQRLMEAVRKHNQDVKFFCVGDDWQAINGFAGSNLKFYEDFDTYFPRSKQLHLSTNYRSVSSVVTVGNALMASYGKPARAHNKVEGIVRIVNLSQFSPTIFEEDKYKNGTLTPVILRLAGKALNANKSIVLLSRRKDLFIPSGGSITIDKYLEILRKEIPKEWRDRIIISTAHSFKGRQGDVVIVMDAFERNYPLIHPNWVFARVLGESLQQIDDENRRLFYVSLTRAKEEVFIITEDGKMSPYLDDIKNFVGIPAIDWKKYPPTTGSSDNLVVRISGSFYELTDELKADGFQFRRNKGKPIRDKIFIKKEFSICNLQGTTWARKALTMPESRFEVRVLDGFDKLLESYSVVCGKWTPFYDFEVDSNDVAPLVVKTPPPIAKETQEWLKGRRLCRSNRTSRGLQDGEADCPF